MKKQTIFALLTQVIISFSTLLQGEIVEAPHFCDLASHITPETVIVLDIDDTLLIPVQMLGCDEWRLYRLKAYQEEGMKGSQAFEKSLAEWEAIRYLTNMEIVEPGTEALISTLQKKGYCVMGLTSQGLTLATRTVQQLNQANIDLALTAPSQEEHYVQVKGHGALYRKGVLFTSGTHKGEAFFKLCEQMGFQPKRVVFVNDKFPDIAQIEESAKRLHVDFLGLRYAYSDARKAAFRPEIAEFQFAHSTFQHLLSDEEARVMMKR